MSELIRLLHVDKSYDKKGKERQYAVKDFTLDIYAGESIGLVGESGCGKSTLARCLLQLEHITSGKVYFDSQDITNKSKRVMQPYRQKMQMVFQSNYNALDPYSTVRQTLMEPIKNHLKLSKAEAEDLMVDTLKHVQIDASYLDRYPSELSGGQCQRIGIARALILKPKFVICDEAVSSLDYGIRNAILDLLIQLKKDYQLTYLFISHDLTAVQYLCDRVVVMYMGHIVEIVSDFSVNKIRHPYTKALMAAKLSINPHDRSSGNILLKKEEDFSAPEQGCVLQKRCIYATELCCDAAPELKSSNGRDYCACHYAHTNAFS